MNQKNSTQLLAPTHHFTVLLSPTPRGARLARILATEWLRTWDLPCGVIGAAEHVVAELAANAATHGRLPGRNFRLALLACSAFLRIEVTDTRGDDLPHRRLPTADAETGRGLLLAESLADRWGTELGPAPRRTAWAMADPDLVAPRDAAAHARPLTHRGPRAIHAPRNDTLPGSAPSVK